MSAKLLPWHDRQSRCPVCGDPFGHNRSDARYCDKLCRNAWRNRAVELGEIILTEWPELARALNPVTESQRALIACAVQLCRARLNEQPPLDQWGAAVT